MLKKLTAAVTAILTVCCADVVSVSAAEIENLDSFGYKSVVNVPVLDAGVDLSDTDPTHDENYIKYVESLREYGYKPVPELVETFRSKYTFEEPDIINVYSKESGQPRCSYEVESVHIPFVTRITVSETNIDTESVANDIKNIINSENAEVSAYNASKNTFFSITFNDFSPEESYELSLKVADMLSENYTIESAVENFSYRKFDDLTVEYDVFIKAENSNFVMMHDLSAEELENFNKKLSENNVKAHFETSTESESYGLAIYDEGLTSAEIRENAEKIQEITGFSPQAGSTEVITPSYGLCVNFSARYKVSDEIKERMEQEQTAIPVVLTYENMSLYNVEKTYTSKVNDYKELIAMQYAFNYTAEEKKKLIEDFKTTTWTNLISRERENRVKYVLKYSDLSIDDVSYSIGESKISCTLTPEQIDNIADSNNIKSIRIIYDGEDFDTENQAYYDSFSPVEGDANGDKRVSISDSVCILQYIANAEKYPISPTLLVNSDIADNDGVSAYDASYIQKIDAGLV